VHTIKSAGRESRLPHQNWAKGILDARFKTRGALLADKRRRTNPSFYTELISHADVTERRYVFVDCAEV